MISHHNNQHSSPEANETFTKNEMKYASIQSKNQNQQKTLTFSDGNKMYIYFSMEAHFRYTTNEFRNSLTIQKNIQQMDLHSLAIR